jgi:hypothetical protein
MKRLNLASKIVVGLVVVGILFAAPIALADASSQPCVQGDPGYPSTKTFLGLVPWYQYLLGNFREITSKTTINGASTTVTVCGFQTSFVNTAGNVPGAAVTGVNGGATGLGVVWLIGLAIFEDLLRVAGLAAVAFVIYGGIRYITSQGEPEGTKGALSTIVNALIGLVIAIIAAATVSFIANSLG